jgi:hypothetical protein
MAFVLQVSCGVRSGDIFVDIGALRLQQPQPKSKRRQVNSGHRPAGMGT